MMSAPEEEEGAEEVNAEPQLPSENRSSGLVRRESTSDGLQPLDGGTSSGIGAEGNDPTRSMPAELVRLVMRQMHVDDICRAQLVCRQWYTIMNHGDDAPGGGGQCSSQLWKQVYFNTWPLPVISSRFTGSSPASENGESLQDWRRIAIERAMLQHKDGISQQEAAKRLVEELCDRANLLDEGMKATYLPTRGDCYEEEEEKEEEGEGANGDGAGKQAGKNAHQRVEKMRKAKQSGLIGPGLDLYSLAQLSKATYRKIRSQMYREQLVNNMRKFLELGLIDVHLRDQKKGKNNDQVKKAIEVFTALQPNILYRRVHIKTKRILFMSKGDYTVEVIIYSIATGWPIYIYLKQQWDGDMSFDVPDEIFYCGTKPYTDYKRAKSERRQNPQPRHDDKPRIKNMSHLQIMLLGEEKKELVTYDQTRNFLNAILNTDDTTIMSLNYY